MVIAVTAVTWVEIGRVLADTENTNISDIVMLLVAVIGNIILAVVTQAGQDFIEPTGTVTTYMGNSWVWGIFLGQFLLSLGFVFVVLLLQFRALAKKRGYGWGSY